MPQTISYSRFIASSLLMPLLILPCLQAQELKDDLHLVEKIRALILKKSAISKESAMKDYQARIPKTGVPYDMVAIKSGSFLMGSPDDEKGRQKDEGPQHKVKVEAFWMGKYEVTQKQFIQFALTKNTPYRTRHGSLFRQPSLQSPDSLITAISAPSEYAAYKFFSFAQNENNLPVTEITQHAASKFCQWLSAQTGHYYRLPTEAEWEYACRAGTATSYSFGNDIKQLKDYAVFDAEQYSLVGSKKPNPWGLYDMHGNVMEWCLDQYQTVSYRINNKTYPAKQLYPRVIRGGSWYDYSDELRSAARFHSENTFKQNDPLTPKSYWHLSDASWLGFRIVRPLKLPSAERMFQLWNSGDIEEQTTRKKTFNRR
ncbi:MAG: formylglycine-generating enzyme family protein [Verrucomicrobiales bacterium]|nr:formylglycine-generating enzyme family protein [Verrucomicrobiales bacterium]